MASPQLQDGYTPIANELLEALYRTDLVGGEFALVLCFMRASYGWSRREAPISIREAGRRLGKHYTHVKRTARGLMARGILARNGDGILIAKDYERWGPRTVPGTVNGPGDHACAQGGTTDEPIGGTKLVPTSWSNPSPRKGPQPRKTISKTNTKTNRTAELTWEQFIQGYSPLHRDVLHQVVQAIASTRKSGRVAPSVLDALARKMACYPQTAVLHACRVYLDRHYAADGKAEAYLLGIIRQEAKRTVQGRDDARGAEIGPRMATYFERLAQEQLRESEQ